MIVTAVTTGIETSTNASQFPVQQIEYMGKTTDCLVFFPYGQFARLPKEQFLLLFSIAGEENHRAAFGSGDPTDRPEINQGEVVYFHPESQTKLTFKNGGELEIDSKSDLNITVNGDVNITANEDVNITANGDVNITPGGRVNLGSGGDTILRDSDLFTVTVGPPISAILPVLINLGTGGSGNNKST